MRKMLVAVVVMACMAVLLGGCGGGDPEHDCAASDAPPCAPLLPPQPCGASGCNN